MLFIKGFRPNLKKFNLWFVKLVMKILATFESLKKNSEYSDVIFLIKLSERLPLINLFVAYCKRDDNYYLIWLIILTSESKSLICCDKSSIYLSLEMNYSSFDILFCRSIFRAYYILINLHTSPKNYSLLSAST